jgi:hypothetical protein
MFSNKNSKFYKSKTSLEDRKVAFQKSLPYPDHVPIIVDWNDSTLDLKKHKYLVQKDITANQFLFILRKRLNILRADEGLFLFCQNILPPSSSCMSSLYSEYRDKEDGFLYFVLCKENVFGNEQNEQNEQKIGDNFKKNVIL